MNWNKTESLFYTDWSIPLNSDSTRGGVEYLENRERWTVAMPQNQPDGYKFFIINTQVANIQGPRPLSPSAVP